MTENQNPDLQQSSESAHSDHAKPSQKCSIHQFFQLLHGQCTHGLGGRLGLEDTWLLGEGVDAFASWRGWFLLQLQVQTATQLERTILLQFRSTNLKETINHG